MAVEWHDLPKRTLGYSIGSVNGGGNAPLPASKYSSHTAFQTTRNLEYSQFHLKITKKIIKYCFSYQMRLTKVRAALSNPTLQMPVVF